MIWSSGGAEELRGLSSRIERVETYPLFRSITPRLDAEEAQMAAMSDKLQIMSFAVMETG